MSDSRLRDKVAIITRESKGIGKDIAEVFAAVFAAAGAKLVLVARDKAVLARTVAKITQAGGQAAAFAGDVSKAADMDRLAKFTVDRFGRIDILCHNAGIFPSVRIEDMTEADWVHVNDVNLKGTFLTVKACLPAMKKQSYGRIVVTSSITGPRTGNPGLAHYAATKAGINGFMRTAAIEFAKHHITINGVEPGNIMTEAWTSQLGADYIRDQEQSIPMGKLGTPEDVGYAALFLASDEAKYITGTTLVVDGGQTLPESRFAVS